MIEEGDKMTKAEKELALKSAILAGKLMLESGAEMNRVEDTMNRVIDVSMEDDSGVSFVVPTALFMGIQEGKGLRMERTHRRTMNLEKVAQVNQVSRSFGNGEMNVQELHKQLKYIEGEEVTYPMWMKILASGAVSGFLMMLFNGVWSDFFLTAVIGGLGYAGYLLMKQYISVRFVPDFLASFLIGIFTLVCIRAGLITSQDSVITGSLMMLVPGVQFTNAMRDFIAGNMISGTVFIIEALFVGIMIGAGITIAFQVFF